ncbi:outer membrane beta-barrel protein [Flammeovirga agarivorans]|uniref:Porin family protein n=1 Tax=Flammeovirga agarivorans TaxID=2726742 RepID=A0A7X8SM52_9BACT|nr:outer membrane beta-barrel protein [Flammeovirga agarivorans]NLR92758.1 porin family protein [Flammeovirga agarivorans]
MQKKEDRRDDFDMVWHDAFQNESVNPPLDLWDDIEVEVDAINKKKNHFTFIRSVAAIFTVSMLTSFLVKYDAPRSQGVAYQSPTMSKGTQIEEASVLPTRLLSTGSDQISTLATHQYTYNNKIVDENIPPINIQEVGLLNDGEEKRNNDKMIYSELGAIKRESTSSASHAFLTAKSSMPVPFSVKQKTAEKKSTYYVGVEAGVASIDPNMKYEGQKISSTTTAPVVTLKGGVKFKNKTFIELGVQYAKYAFDTDLPESSEIVVDQQQISVPVKVGYTFEGKKLDLDVFASVAANFNVDQEVSGGSSEFHRYMIEKGVENKVNMSAAIGAELNYKVAPNTSVSLGTSYGTTLTEASNQNDISTQPNTVMLSMGVKYKFI